jgi:hypothetical protein
MTKKMKRLIVIIPVICVLVALGVVYLAIQAASTGKPVNEQLSAAAPVEAAPVQENGTAMAPAADVSVPPDATVAPLADGAASPTGEPGVSEGGEIAPNEVVKGKPSADVVTGEAKPACEFHDWIGKRVNEAAIKATKRPYRIVAPGQPVTMEYSAERINVMVNPMNMVVQVTCG